MNFKLTLDLTFVNHFYVVEGDPSVLILFQVTLICTRSTRTHVYWYLCVGGCTKLPMCGVL